MSSGSTNVDALGLRPAESGANVLIVEPGDDYVFEGSEEIQGLRYAAPSQVAADLLTSPGRGPAEGEALLEWMKGNEEAWRGRTVLPGSAGPPDPGEGRMRIAPIAMSSRTKTVAYDVAEQLRTPEEMAAYLDAWLSEAPGDPAGIARVLGRIARAKGMSQVARDAGLTRESLYKAFSEERNPSFARVLEVARALGVRLHAGAA